MQSSNVSLAAILVLWVALLALTSIVLRELGLARLKRYRGTLLFLCLALLSVPGGAVLLKVLRPYQRRIVALVTRKRSAPVAFSGGCRMFPENNIWNTRVDNLP